MRIKKVYTLVEDIIEYKDERSNKLVLQSDFFEEEDKLGMTGLIADFRERFS